MKAIKADDKRGDEQMFKEMRMNDPDTKQLKKEKRNREEKRINKNKISKYTVSRLASITAWKHARTCRRQRT